IHVVTARHPKVTEKKLWEESQIKANEDHQNAELGPSLRIGPAGHLWPPDMDCPHVAHDGATNHNVVEMGHYEIGIVYVDIQTHNGQKHTRESADGEKPDKAEYVQHRCVITDRSLVKSGRSVKDLNGGGDGNEHRQHRKDHPGVHRLTAYEKVVTPDQKPEDGNGQTGECHKTVPENTLSAETGDNFADHPHRGKDHNVHGRVGIKPEEVLEEDRVTSQGRVKDADSKHSLHSDQKD